MNKKYTHLFFDLDNTLWDFEMNSRKAMEETFLFFGMQNKVDFDLFYSTYSKHNSALWKSYRNKEVVKKELTKKRFGNAFAELGVTGIDPERMNEHYLNVMPLQKELNDGVIDTLDYLLKRNYSLFIITNGFKKVQNEKMISSGLSKYFSKIFISEDVKIPKPGREIFECAVKSSNAKKSKSVMIGDDWDVDIIGAMNFGMDAIHFLNDSNQEIQIQPFENKKNLKTYKIGKMAQLKSIL